MTWQIVNDRRAEAAGGFVAYDAAVDGCGDAFYFEWVLPLFDYRPFGPESHMYVSVGRMIDILRAHGYAIAGPGGAPEPSIWNDDIDEETLECSAHGVVTAHDLEIPTSVIAELLRRQGYAVEEPREGHVFDDAALAIAEYGLGDLDTHSANRSLRWTGAYRLIRCHGMASLEAGDGGEAFVATCRRGGVEEWDLDAFRMRRRRLPCRRGEVPRVSTPEPAHHARSPDGRWMVEALDLAWSRTDRTVTRPTLRVTEARPDPAGGDRLEVAGSPVFTTWRGEHILVGLEDGTIHAYRYEPAPSPQGAPGSVEER